MFITSVMRLFVLAVIILSTASNAFAQNPPPPPTSGGGAQSGTQQQQRGGGAGNPQQGRGGGRGGVQVMMLSTTGWKDGSEIPITHSQAGAEVSPPLAWGDPPQGTASFVLLVHNVNAVSGQNMDSFLHWLVWNIPATARNLQEGFPQGPQQPDGVRQISASGPYYRGPAAPATGPHNHYLFELYAVDTLIAVEPAAASAAATRAAVMVAMSGRVRGKAVLVGTFKRPE